MTKASTSALSLVTLVAASIALAPAAQAGWIQDRKGWQQQRISEGVRSGQLTAAETTRLELRESALNREERAMRRADCGRLTARDRAVLNEQQDRLSREIYREKHDGERRY